MPFGIILVGIVGGAIAKYIGGDGFEEDVIETDNRAVIPDNIKDLVEKRSKPESFTVYDPILMEEKVLSLDNPNTVVIYIYDKGSFKYGYCFERVDLFRFLRRVVKDLNESEETSEVKCIWKKYKEDENSVSGYGCRPTDQYIANGINFVVKYFMLIDFIPLLLNKPNEREFYAIPVENGKPRRIGNPYGGRGASADHGQIPGSTVYELFSATDFNPRPITLFRGVYDNNINYQIKNQFTDFYKQFYSRSKGLFRTESDASGLTLQSRRRSLQRQQSGRRDSLGSLNGESDNDYDPDDGLAAQRDYDDYMAERYYSNYGYPDDITDSDEEDGYYNQDVRSQRSDGESQYSVQTDISYYTEMGIGDLNAANWLAPLSLERYQTTGGNFRIGQFLIDASSSQNFEEYRNLFTGAFENGITPRNYETVMKVVLSTCNVKIFEAVINHLLNTVGMNGSDINKVIMNNMSYMFDRLPIIYETHNDYFGGVIQVLNFIDCITGMPFYNNNQIFQYQGKKSIKCTLHYFIKQSNRSIGIVQDEDSISTNFINGIYHIRDKLSAGNQFVDSEGRPIDLFHVLDNEGHKPIYYIYNPDLEETLQAMLDDAITEVTNEYGTVRTRAYLPQDFNEGLFDSNQREYYENIPDIIEDYLGRPYYNDEE